LVPSGQEMSVSAPYFVLHSSLEAERKLVSVKVEPEPSERCTAVIFMSGSAISGLTALIAGSDQFWILPR
jgi:hypothetical protein